MKTIRQQIECVDREVLLRKSVYPKLIRDGKMTKEKAQAEIETMSAVRDSLLLMPKDASLIKIEGKPTPATKKKT